MRSLFLKLTVAAGAAFALAGCLVSEEPVLDAKTGKATPLDPGAYEMCPASEDGGEDSDENDCERFSITVDETKLYRFAPDDNGDDASDLRFRRIARGGYAVQAKEDDGYMYYYGRREGERFTLIMMMCAALPEKTRDRLIDRGDLVSDDENFETCEVKTLAGLRGAAMAYHRGRASDAEESALVFTPLATP